MGLHSRRGFLAATFGTIMGKSVLRAAQARAQSGAAPAGLFDLHKVAEGIYAAVAKPAALTNCNAAIFENANDLMVVDSHSKPSAAASLVAQIKREIGPKPVRYIVNTHFHWDHTQGTAGLTASFPGAQVVSSTATRKLLEEFGARRLQKSLEEFPKQLEDGARKLAAARTPEEKAFFEKSISEVKAYMAEMQNYEPELPTVTFQDTLVLHDKAHELHLMFRGRGHTAGDVVVYCPQKRAVATGDLAHGFFPFIGDGYPREWPRTLRTVAGLEFDHLLGGHGAPQRGRDRMLQMGAYIEELTEVVAREKQAGRPLEEIKRTVTPAQLKSIANGGYGEFVVTSLKTYASIAPSTAREQVLENSVRDNIASIYNVLERT